MSTDNLENSQAIEKLKDIAEDVKFAMMVTNLTEQPLNAIPMTTKMIEDDGSIWFLSNANSDHNKDLANDTACQLLYSGGSDMKFLSVYGTGHVTTNRETIKELYSSTDNVWFDGVDDPAITAIKFIPSNAAYWDSGSNRLITLFKLAKGAITGEKQDIGNSGKLSL